MVLVQAKLVLSVALLVALTVAYATSTGFHTSKPDQLVVGEAVLDCLPLASGGSCKLTVHVSNRGIDEVRILGFKFGDRYHHVELVVPPRGSVTINVDLKIVDPYAELGGVKTLVTSWGELPMYVRLILP